MSPDHARAYLLHAAGIGERFPPGHAGLVALLDRLDVIQLDPIDRVGQNADLVAAARVDGVARGDIHRALAGRSFEHFAKERCIVHARHFPHYRQQAIETQWWRNTERMSKLDEAILADVLAEVRQRGPLTTDTLSSRGKIEAMDWNGWKGTSRKEVLALEALWARCDVVVSGRDAKGKRLYGTPEQLLPAALLQTEPTDPFAEVLLLSRVRSAGLLARAGGPTWSMLSKVRTDGTVERMLADGRLVEVRVGRRPYLALSEFNTFDAGSFLSTLDHPPVALGPLDPLLWDRALVHELFQFEYLWEVYKPAAQRRWGYYVLPLLVGGKLLGRIEARRESQALVLEKTWGDTPAPAEQLALHRLVRLNGLVALDTSRVIRH